MNTFNASRLQLARERRSLFKKEFAERCGVTPETVTRWETAQKKPSPDAQARIAEELMFPESFFLRPTLDGLGPDAPFFRARSKMTARQRKAALASGTLACELAMWIEERFLLPEVNLPRYDDQVPKIAAECLRTEWMLGIQPISNMIRLLESRGILVFSLAQDCSDLDAFSFWAGKRPIVLLNTMKSAERSRFDAAHELFHLIGHKEGASGRKEEAEADEFAGALLLPEEDVRSRIRRVVSLQSLIEAKKRWGISLAAMVYSLHKLQILSDWQYRTFYIEMSKRKYTKQEPEPISRENSSVLSQVFATLKTQNVTPRSIAMELDWPYDQLKEFLLGLGATVFSIDGGGSDSIPGGRDHLRLVGANTAHRTQR